MRERADPKAADARRAREEKFLQARQEKDAAELQLLPVVVL
jgi:hypothetical protein